MTNKQLLELVEKYPNDLDLGSAVRKLSWEVRNNANEVYVNPNQVTIDQMINEIQNTETNGSTRL